MRKLYKSENDRILLGVIGGIGEYTDIDPTVLRLVFIVLTIMTAIVPAIIGYIIAALIIPKRPGAKVHEAEHKENHHKSEEKKGE